VLEPGPNDAFCLYLWRTVQAPGTLYIAAGLHQATAVHKELVGDGYLVKVVHVNTNTQYVMRDGTLIPAFCADCHGITRGAPESDVKMTALQLRRLVRAIDPGQ
jgi:hypothetical protein